MTSKEALYRTLLLAIILTFAFIALWNLNYSYLWQDEAYTGFVASNFVRTGHLSCSDGRNIYAVFDGAQLRDDFTQPDQLTPDIAGAIGAFKLFGISTWATRLPSALFGIAALICFLVVLRREFPGMRTLHILTLACLAFSAQFDLDARTGRYYTCVMLCAILFYHAYRRFITLRTWVNAVYVAITAVMLYYSHLLGGLAFIAAVLLTFVIFHRRKLVASDWAKVVLAVLLFLAATVPQVIGDHMLSYARGSGPQGIRPHLWLIYLNIRDLNLTNCFPWMCALGLIFLLAVRRKDDDVKPIMSKVVEWWSIVVFYAICLAMICAPSQTSMEVATFRYLSPIIPFLCGLCGIFLWMAWRISKPLSAGLLLVVSCTNLLTLTPFPPNLFPATDTGRLLLPALVYEITHPYPTADYAVIRYLKRFAGKDDVVANYPTYHAVTMDFYLGDVVRTGALLDYNSPLPRDIVERINPALYIDEAYPQWVVFYGPTVDPKPILARFSRPHPMNGKLVSFHYLPAKYLNVYWAETNRGELIRHVFGPVTVDNPGDGVTIYRRESDK